MQVITGPFHPHLEEALTHEIRTYKGQDPFCPLLVLVPSEPLRKRIKIILTQERKIELLNLHVLTFHQLSRNLHQERFGPTDINLHDDIFLEEVLRTLLPRDFSEKFLFAGMDETEGGCAALWQTLRDLKDGLIDSPTALEALREGHFGKDRIRKTSDLLKLYNHISKRCHANGVLDYTDLDVIATEHTPSSGFLKQFQHIFHYGFYDLTQVQLDLFHAVARHHAATLFFPLVTKHPGWLFAERFYERHVQTVATEPPQHLYSEPGTDGDNPPIHSRLFVEDAPEGSTSRLTCQIMNCSGPRDEILTAGKEILKLITEEGIAFSEIGLVARNLDSYLLPLREIFPGNGIPFSCNAQEPLVRFPLAKAVLLLINLSQGAYLRSKVIDLISSPYFDASAFCPEGCSPRPDLWDLISREIGVTKGPQGWSRLERYIRDKRKQPAQNGDQEALKTNLVPIEQARSLWSIYRSLQQDLENLPAESSWSDYARHWKMLLQKYLGLNEDKAGTDPESQDQQITGVILETLDRLASLEAIIPRTSRKKFGIAIQRWLERASIQTVNTNLSGVSVLDAMEARGTAFKVLFIIGLNEGNFPRTIREDAFLRDDVRHSFETVLGNKVGEKLAAFNEEKLLFTLLVGSAKERLYCLYQRSDEEGKPLIPSWYLTELRRAVSGKDAEPVTEHSIPRGTLEKYSLPLFNPTEMLHPHELAIRLSLLSQDPAPALKLSSGSDGFYRHRKKTLDYLQRWKGLNPHDGITGPLQQEWKSLQLKGVSPTSLENYAQCPFKYFSTHVLRLRPLETPDAIPALGPLEKGQLCHEILKDFYSILLTRKYFTDPDPAIDTKCLLEEAAQSVFSTYEQENPVGFSLSWEAIQNEMLKLLQDVTTRDLQELSASGYIPLDFEAWSEHRLEGKWPPIMEGLTIHGRLDRIDYHPELGRYRVIDYKFKSGKNPKAEDKNLHQSAIQGRKLQPPFYLLMAGAYAAQHNHKGTDPTIETAFYYLAPKWPKGPLEIHHFPGNGWEEEPGTRLKNTVSILLQGIKEGQFFIVPDTYCDRCEMSAICRKEHQPTKARAKNDPRIEPHRSLRKETLPRTKTGTDKNPTLKGKKSK